MKVGVHGHIALFSPPDGIIGGFGDLGISSTPCFDQEGPSEDISIIVLNHAIINKCLIIVC